MANRSTCIKSLRKWRQARLRRGWNLRKTPWRIISRPRYRPSKRILARIRRNPLNLSKLPRKPIVSLLPNPEKASMSALTASYPVQNRAFFRSISGPTRTRDRIHACCVDLLLKRNQICISIADRALTRLRWREEMRARYVVSN